MVAVIFQSPALTQGIYEASIRRLTGGRSDRLESPADWPVPGIRAHVAGQDDGVFRVVDVWESDDAFRRFGELLVPILEELGVHEQPDVFPVHTLVTA